jgi:hypothetical protein
MNRKTSKLCCLVSVLALAACEAQAEEPVGRELLGLRTHDGSNAPAARDTPGRKPGDHQCRTPNVIARPEWPAPLPVEAGRCYKEPAAQLPDRRLP